MEGFIKYEAIELLQLSKLDTVLPDSFCLQTLSDILEELVTLMP